MDPPAISTVVVIEDHAAIRRLITVVLERVEAHLVFANTGLEGLEAIDSFDPDLVLLDIRLPDMDGWEVLAWIRHRRDHAHLPVLVVTAYGGDGDEQQAYAKGADGYLPKPFEPAALRQAVTDLLGGCLAR